MLIQTSHPSTEAGGSTECPCLIDKLRPCLRKDRDREEKRERARVRESEREKQGERKRAKRVGGKGEKGQDLQ